jgi:hypothetical protein
MSDLITQTYFASTYWLFDLLILLIFTSFIHFLAGRSQLSSILISRQKVKNFQ